MIWPGSLVAAVGFGAVTVAVAMTDPETTTARRYRALLAVVFGASALSYAGIGLGGETGRVLWLHYAEWLVGTPAYVAAVFLLSGEPRTVRLAVALDVLMVTAGLGAAVTAGARRFVLFGLSTLALCGLFALLVRSTGAGGWRSELYDSLKRLFVVVAPGYPVVWLLGVEGLGLVGAGATNLGFLVLDGVVKGGLLFLFVRRSPVFGRERGGAVAA